LLSAPFKPLKGDFFLPNGQEKHSKIWVSIHSNLVVLKREEERCELQKQSQQDLLATEYKMIEFHWPTFVVYIEGNFSTISYFIKVMTYET
jgi:hypothetical protein